jgi:hypothetical protein
VVADWANALDTKYIKNIVARVVNAESVYGNSFKSFVADFDVEIYPE